MGGGGMRKPIVGISCILEEFLKRFELTVALFMLINAVKTSYHGDVLCFCGFSKDQKKKKKKKERYAFTYTWKNMRN